MRRESLVALVMAGGEGNRLYPLTAHRSKPAVAFGGRYRIVDFVLSNLVNSGIQAIYLLVQYQSLSLIEHVRKAWIGAPHTFNRQFITLVPPQMCDGMGPFQGTANAVYQNLHLIREHQADLVAVFGSDHVYRMDIRQMIDFHREREAAVTVAAVPVPVSQGPNFGIIEADADGRIRCFQEKPPVPAELRDRPGWCYASMGNYLFRADLLTEALQAAQSRGDYDFGKDVLPRLLESHRVYAYDFSTNRIPGNTSLEQSYWRDVGNIDAYFEANQDLLGERPRFDEFQLNWPVSVDYYIGPVAKILDGTIQDSLIGGGVLVRHAAIRHSIIRRHVLVDEGAEIDDCIIMGFTRIGPGAKLRRAIIDRCNDIPAGAVIGYDQEADGRYYHISPGGIVVTPRGLHIPEPVSSSEAA